MLKVAVSCALLAENVVAIVRVELETTPEVEIPNCRLRGIDTHVGGGIVSIEELELE